MPQHPDRRCAPWSACAIATASLALLGGCSGYRVGAEKPVEFEHISTIAVPAFKNDTLEPRLGTYFTHAVVKEFQNDGTYAVGSTANADAVLRGTISRIDHSQLRSARFNTLRSRELRMVVHIDYELLESATGVVLDRGTVRGTTNIFIDPNFQLTERQAFDEMSRRVATDLVSRLSEGWPGAPALGAPPVPGSLDDDERERRLRSGEAGI